MPPENGGKKHSKGDTLCPMCRKPLKPNSFFCTGCGHRIGEPPKADAQPTVNPELLKYQRRAQPITPPEQDNHKQKNEPSPSSLAFILKDFQSKYLIFIIVAGVFILSGLGLFAWARAQYPRLERPVQMDETADGVYISSTKMIAKYTSDGDLEWKLSRAAKDRPLSGRLEYSFGPGGNLYVANTEHSTIEIISNDGKWLRAIGKSDFSTQFTMTFLKDGRLAVADTLAHAVLVYNEQGDLEARLGGSPGSGDEQFNFPTGIAQLPNGLIHVVDSGNQRMQRIDLQFIFRDPWDLSLRNISVPDRGGMLQSAKDALFEKTFSAQRILFDPVRDHVHTCYGTGGTQFPSRESFIVRYDKDGAVVESVELAGPEGKPLNPQRLRRALDDKIALVDSDAYIVGLWDPAANMFETLYNSGVSLEMQRMKDSSGRVRALRGVGLFLFFLGILGILAGAGMVLKEYIAAQPEKTIPSVPPTVPQNEPKPGNEPPNLV